ncbi:MAG: prolipoprotein diacylglyceryl transferase [Actinomycetota bacterium]
MTHALATIGWPVLDRIHIGSTFAISPHGVGIAAGYLFGSWWMLREGPRRGLDERHISSILFWALIGAIVGARVFYVIAHWSDFSGHPVDVLKVYNGGISLLGGIAGAIIFAYPLMRRARYRFLQVMDSAALGLAAGVILGRIGDLIIGDHLGKPTSSFLAFQWLGGKLSGFECTLRSCTESLVNGQTLAIARGKAQLISPNGIVVGQGAGVHQTALYDFFSTILLFLFLYLVMNRRVRREGVLICTWAVWYLGVRVWTDFLRVDKRFAGLTGSQWTAAIIGGIAAAALIRWWIQARRAGPTAAHDPGAPSTVFAPPADPSA